MKHYRGPSVWDNAELDKRLEVLWTEGWSCSVIAAMLNAEYATYFRKCFLKHGITKNAVIGRVHRKKLPERGWGWNGTESRKTARRNGSEAKMMEKWAADRPSKTLRKPYRQEIKVAPVKVAPDPKRPSAVIWEDLDLSQQCRRVIGEVGKGHRHCGQPTIPGDVWCSDCRTEVYVPIQVSQRRRVRVDETEIKIREFKKSLGLLE